MEVALIAAVAGSVAALGVRGIRHLPRRRLRELTRPHGHRSADPMIPSRRHIALVVARLRQPPAAGLVGDLPFGAELLAATLRAGLPPDAASIACGQALGGALGDIFVRAGRALRLGAPPTDAWQYLDAVPEARSLVRVLVRSADNGSGCADAAVQLAQELRAAQQQAALARARRAGVLVVLPLGLCFLPAFVLAGVVPVVSAVLRGALS
jgi:Flp pilus assembly protein TadB